ncbi:MAG: transposase family protein [Desulfobacterales bacterium]
MKHHDFSISNYFANVEDPRKYNILLTRLSTSLPSRSAPLICDAQNWGDVEQYGKSKYQWLKQFLALPNGITSHDTFGRVFSMLIPNNSRRHF